MFWKLNILLVFFICVFCTGVLIPKILVISFRKKLFDIPDERKIHRNPIPRLGGLAFVPVILFSISYTIGLDFLMNKTYVLNYFGDHIQPFMFGMAAILTLYMVGIGDDLIGVRYRTKFVFQTFCALLLASSGIWMFNMNGFMGMYVLPKWVGIPLTMLIVVFIINAINLIDGIDGLASGLCALAFLYLGIIFYFYEMYVYVIIAVAGLGVLLPFFYFNVFGKADKYNKIFMGDAGSLTIGFLVCMLCVRMATIKYELPFIKNYNPFIIGFSPVIIPCLDVVRVVLSRVLSGHNPFLPDKSHIHHKLLEIGFSPAEAMMFILAFSLVILVLNYFLSPALNVNLIVLLDILLYSLLGYIVFLIKKRRQSADSVQNT